MAIIDNKSQTMHEALINALTCADQVDIEVAKNSLKEKIGEDVEVCW